MFLSPLSRFLPFFSVFNLFHLKKEKKIEDLPMHRRRLFPLLFYCVSKAWESKARLRRGTLFCLLVLPVETCYRLLLHAISAFANAPTELLLAPRMNTTFPIILCMCLAPDGCCPACIRIASFFFSVQKYVYLLATYYIIWFPSNDSS